MSLLKMSPPTMSPLKKYGFVWVSLLLLLVSLAGHWLFGWYAYVDDQQTHHMQPLFAGYLNEMLRDTFENWQSEFLQLIWQVMGLALLLHVGSPQSKDSSDRQEAKIDAILRQLDPAAAERVLSELEEKYPKS